MNKGTKVQNPVARDGWTRFVVCSFCKRWYTRLGISRHWEKCKANPNRRSV